MTEIEGQWDIILSSLQDIFNNNEELEFDKSKEFNSTDFSGLTNSQLDSTLEQLKSHKHNIDRSRRVLDETIETLNSIMFSEMKKKSLEPKQKIGRSFWESPYNVSDTIKVGSDVAFKLRQRGTEDEWIQCEVTKIMGDGTKYVLTLHFMFN